MVPDFCPLSVQDFVKIVKRLIATLYRYSYYATRKKPIYVTLNFNPLGATQVKYSFLKELRLGSMNMKVNVRHQKGLFGMAFFSFLR